jgi:hypothetical protein
MTKIEGGSFASIGSHAYEFKGHARLIQEPPQKRRTDAGSARRSANIEMSDATDAAPFDVGIAVEPTHADQFGLRPRSEQTFARLIKSVRAHFPITDQPIQEPKALIGRLGSKCIHADTTYGHWCDLQRSHPQYPLCDARNGRLSVDGERRPRLMNYLDPSQPAGKLCLRERPRPPGRVAAEMARASRLATETISGSVQPASANIVTANVVEMKIHNAGGGLAGLLPLLRKIPLAR